MFFVISGYLITTLIACDLDAHSFVLAEFWTRRIQRIWPASLAMTIATLVAGWVFLLPYDLRALGGNAIAHLCMAMNLRLWLFMDYFAPAADLQPLLHTWSLAVEEQFYMLFPLLLMVLWPYGPRVRFSVLAALAGASFVAAQLMLPTHGRGVFYLLPFRSWEILLGSLLALAPRAIPRTPRSAHALAFSGIAMIIGPAMLYSAATPFPAAAAVPPCLGAALVIAAGSGCQNLVTHALSHPVLVTIGRMSYSLYLWHWPVLAFLRYRNGVDLSLQQKVAVAVTTAMITCVSYFAIESPLRRGTPRFNWRVVVATCAMSLMTLLTCQVLRLFEGVPHRLPSAIMGFATSEVFTPRAFTPRSIGAREADHAAGNQADGDDRCCFMLVGDSHGMVIQPYISEEARHLGLSGFAVLEAGVLPIPKESEHSVRQADVASIRNLFGTLTEKRPRNLVLCARWSLYLSGDARLAIVGVSPDMLRARVRELCRICKDINCEIWLLTEVPLQPVTPQQRAMRAWIADKPIEG